MMPKPVVVGTDGSGESLHAVEWAAAAVLAVGAYGIGGYAQPGAGPETRYVTLHASCPIAVIRHPGGIEHREIAVGVRDADDAEAAFRFAFEEAALRKARLTVVHAGDEHNPPVAHLAESLGHWRHLFPHVAVSHNEIDGHPGRTLTSYSGFMDLIVVGRHDGPNRNAAHGPTLQALLNHAQAPVVIVPSD